MEERDIDFDRYKGFVFKMWKLEKKFSILIDFFEYILFRSKKNQNSMILGILKFQFKLELYRWKYCRKLWVPF